MLRHKAIEIYNELAASNCIEGSVKSNFEASNGFLYKFKKRHGISMKKCSGESFDVNIQNFDDFLIFFHDKVSVYGEENVYNCDETRLFFKLAPTKSLLKQTRKGIRKFKDRITVMLTSNMTGSKKLKPVIIGKSQNPRAFKNFDKGFFCHYYITNLLG
ncbi:Jerky like protein [Dictyocoela muelleri]|nr:Jerky like protein [Dictyocoela muelleri]